jgi:hypothetical protein
MYTVNVLNSMRFFLAIHYVGCNMSFRLNIVAIRHAKECFKA